MSVQAAKMPEVLPGIAELWKLCRLPRSGAGKELLIHAANRFAKEALGTGAPLPNATLPPSSTTACGSPLTNAFEKRCNASPLPT